MVTPSWCKSLQNRMKSPANQVIRELQARLRSLDGGASTQPSSSAEVEGIFASSQLQGLRPPLGFGGVSGGSQKGTSPDREQEREAKKLEFIRRLRLKRAQRQDAQQRECPESAIPETENDHSGDGGNTVVVATKEMLSGSNLTRSTVAVVADVPGGDLTRSRLRGLGPSLLGTGSDDSGSGDSGGSVTDKSKREKQRARERAKARKKAKRKKSRSETTEVDEANSEVG